MTIETFPEDIEFQVVDDVTNRFRAERGDTMLACVTPDGESMNVDLFASGSFPEGVSSIDLIGRHFIAGHLSTAEYFANDITEIQPDALPMKRA